MPPPDVRYLIPDIPSEPKILPTPGATALSESLFDLVRQNLRLAERVAAEQARGHGRDDIALSVSPYTTIPGSYLEQMAGAPEEAANALAQAKSAMMGVQTGAPDLEAAREQVYGETGQSAVATAANIGLKGLAKFFEVMAMPAAAVGETVKEIYRGITEEPYREDEVLPWTVAKGVGRGVVLGPARAAKRVFVGDERQVYPAEALTNVVRHAYNDPDFRLPRGAGVLVDVVTDPLLPIGIGVAAGGRLVLGKAATHIVKGLPEDFVAQTSRRAATDVIRKREVETVEGLVERTGAKQAFTADAKKVGKEYADDELRKLFATRSDELSLAELIVAYGPKGARARLDKFGKTDEFDKFWGGLSEKERGLLREAPGGISWGGRTIVPSRSFRPTKEAMALTRQIPIVGDLIKEWALLKGKVSGKAQLKEWFRTQGLPVDGVMIAGVIRALRDTKTTRAQFEDMFQTALRDQGWLGLPRLSADRKRRVHEFLIGSEVADVPADEYVITRATDVITRLLNTTDADIQQAGMAALEQATQRTTWGALARRLGYTRQDWGSFARWLNDNAKHFPDTKLLEEANDAVAALRLHSFFAEDIPKILTHFKVTLPINPQFGWPRALNDAREIAFRETAEVPPKVLEKRRKRLYTTIRRRWKGELDPEIFEMNPDRTLLIYARKLGDDVVANAFPQKIAGVRYMTGKPIAFDIQAMIKDGEGFWREWRNNAVARILALSPDLERQVASLDQAQRTYAEAKVRGDKTAAERALTDVKDARRAIREIEHEVMENLTIAKAMPLELVDQEFLVSLREYDEIASGFQALAGKVRDAAVTQQMVRDLRARLDRAAENLARVEYKASVGTILDEGLQSIASRKLGDALAIRMAALDVMKERGMGEEATKAALARWTRAIAEDPETTKVAADRALANLSRIGREVLESFQAVEGAGGANYRNLAHLVSTLERALKDTAAATRAKEALEPALAALKQLEPTLDNLLANMRERDPELASRAVQRLDAFLDAAVDVYIRSEGADPIFLAEVLDSFAARLSQLMDDLGIVRPFDPQHPGTAWETAVPRLVHRSIAMDDYWEAISQANLGDIITRFSERPRYAPAFRRLAEAVDALGRLEEVDNYVRDSGLEEMLRVATMSSEEFADYVTEHILAQADQLLPLRNLVERSTPLDEAMSVQESALEILYDPGVVDRAGQSLIDAFAYSRSGGHNLLALDAELRAIERGALGRIESAADFRRTRGAYTIASEVRDSILRVMIDTARRLPFTTARHRPVAELKDLSDDVIFRRLREYYEGRLEIPAFKAVDLVREGRRRLAQRMQALANSTVEAGTVHLKDEEFLGGPFFRKVAHELSSLVTALHRIRAVGARKGIDLDELAEFEVDIADAFIKLWGGFQPDQSAIGLFSALKEGEAQIRTTVSRMATDLQEPTLVMGIMATQIASVKDFGQLAATAATLLDQVGIQWVNRLNKAHKARLSAETTKAFPIGFEAIADRYEAMGMLADVGTWAERLAISTKFNASLVARLSARPRPEAFADFDKETIKQLESVLARAREAEKMVKEKVKPKVWGPQVTEQYFALRDLYRSMGADPSAFIPAPNRQNQIDNLRRFLDLAAHHQVDPRSYDAEEVFAQLTDILRRYKPAEWSGRRGLERLTSAWLEEFGYARALEVTTERGYLAPLTEGAVPVAVPREWQHMHVPQVLNQLIIDYFTPLYLTENVLDKLVRAWKIGVIGFRPSYQIRNFISNMWLAASSGQWRDPVSFTTDIFKVITGRIDDDMVEDMIEAGVLSVGAKAGSVRGVRLWESPISAFGVTELRSHAVLDSGLLDKISRPGMVVTNFNENIFKSAIFMRARKNGFSPSDAAELARESLFDYGWLTTSERKIRRWAVPFYTWIRNNLAYQWYLFMRRPALYTRIVTLPYTLTAEEDAQLGQEPWASLPIRVGDKFYYLDLPYEDILQAGRGAQAVAQYVPGFPKTGEGIVPLGRFVGAQLGGPIPAGAQLLTGYNVYFGKKLEPKDRRRFFLQQLLPGGAPVSTFASRDTSKMWTYVHGIRIDDLDTVKRREAYRRLDIAKRAAVEARMRGKYVEHGPGKPRYSMTVPTHTLPTATAEEMGSIRWKTGNALYTQILRNFREGKSTDIEALIQERIERERRAPITIP